MLAVISSTQTDMRSPKNKRREPRVSAGMTYWEPLELQLSNMEIQPQHNTKKKTLDTGIFSAAVSPCCRLESLCHSFTSEALGQRWVSSPPLLLKTRLTRVLGPFFVTVDLCRERRSPSQPRSQWLSPPRWQVIRLKRIDKGPRLLQLNGQRRE